MRLLVRQSARLVSSNRVRQSSIPRCSTTQHNRAFHGSVKRQSEPRPPAGPTEQHNASEHRRDEHKRHEIEASRSDQAFETENGEAKTGEGRKPGMRRTLRQRRMTDIPRPPPIPEWFLKHNVRLVEDVEDSPHLRPEDAKTIRCIDSETGHILFTVPCYQPKTTMGTDSAVPHPEAMSKAVKRRRTSSTDGSSSIKQDFFDHHVPKNEAQVLSQAETDERSIFEMHAKDQSSGDGPLPLWWTFFEAAAGVRACLSLPAEARSSSAYAASRIDLHLMCPDANAHEYMDDYVRNLAQTTRADLIRIDANDFEELMGEYVGQGHDAPGSFSTLGYDVFDGYEAASVRSGRLGSSKDDHVFDIDEEEYDEDEEEDEDADDRSDQSANFEDLRIALHERRHELAKALQGIGIAGITIGMPRNMRSRSDAPSTTQSPFRVSHAPEYVQWDDARLGALLNSLLDTAKEKRLAGETPFHQKTASSTFPEVLRNTVSSMPGDSNAEHSPKSSHQPFLHQLGADPFAWLTTTSTVLATHLAESPNSSYRLEMQQVRDPDEFRNTLVDGRARTVVHIRDLKDICRSRLGDAVIRRFIRVVQKRRRSGEDILMVGTTAQDGYAQLPGDTDDLPFRSIHVPPFFLNSPKDNTNFMAKLPKMPKETLTTPRDSRILEINLRHIQSMLRRLGMLADLDLTSQNARNQMSLPGTRSLSEKVLSLDHVQRLAITAIGLSQLQAKSDKVQPIHIALATFVTTKVEQIVRTWSLNQKDLKLPHSGSQGKDGDNGSDVQPKRSKIDDIRKVCNPHETRLLSGVVDAQSIKIGFNDVHAPADTIEALKTLTTLSLLRPEAFQYGVLANDRLPGLLLYGPPGTGKTLLAKAVAKESQATVLEVSGAQVYEKYVGEGEKMVRAVFSLAKKLSPCVVFIDEADAIFGSRSNAGNRNTHREIINQFLREWDGMDDHSVFMMVASNRPFDLDDAVLRRLPRRLLIDLPVPKDRQSILGIHLKNEILDSSVSLAKLADQTPLYSGSDLKNLCVAAALACVREENELAERKKDDKAFKLAEKRTLTTKHFDRAIAEISASISEDMSSLTAIRKFDEQYGDRRGRRKKTGYGFGATDGVIDESSVRVRQSTSTPPP